MNKKACLEAKLNDNIFNIDENCKERMVCYVISIFIFISMLYLIILTKGYCNK